MWHARAGWLDRAAVETLKQNAHLAYRPLAKDQLNTASWKRQCNDPGISGGWETAADGPRGEECFHFWVAQLTGWDGYLSQDVQLFGPGHDLFLFQAKGSENTPQVAVEIQEEDGSRWIATAPIGTQWRRIALEPRDFKFWPDASPKAGRGSDADHLHPERARRVCFQLAQSHTTKVQPGAHAFWIADIGTCQNPVAGLTPELTPGASFESIYPRYKVYQLDEPMMVQTAEPGRQGQMELNIERTAGLVSAIDRPRGRGFQRDAPWRYIPLADAIDRNARHRGNPAWLLLNTAGSPSHSASHPGFNSVLACLGCSSALWQTSPQLFRACLQIVKRLQQGVFLQEAGAQHFAYWPGEKVVVGQRSPGKAVVPFRPHFA